MARKVPVWRGCDFPGCERPHKGLGYCGGHYQQLKSGRELKPLANKRRKPQRVCDFPDCGRPHQSNGYCIGHVAQLKVGKELTPLWQRKVRFCELPYCDREHSAYGYCAVHWAHVQAGKELRPVPRRRRRPKAESPEVRWCHECQRFLPLADFGIYKGRRRHNCYPCSNVLLAARRFGLTTDEVRQLRTAVTCESCGGHSPGVAFETFLIDHDHRTGEVRGMVCHHCNAVIGHARDQVLILELGACYIEKHQGLLKFESPGGRAPKRDKPTDVPDGFAWCLDCEKALPVDRFGIWSKSGEPKPYCHRCRNIRDTAKKYRTTIAHIVELRSRSKCDLCGFTEPGSQMIFHIDHCHSSGVIRGVLCHNCNLMLGHAQDSPARLRAVADYIRRYGIDYITRYAASRRAA